MRAHLSVGLLPTCLIFFFFFFLLYFGFWFMKFPYKTTAFLWSRNLLAENVVEAFEILLISTLLIFLKFSLKKCMRKYCVRAMLGQRKCKHISWKIFSIKFIDPYCQTCHILVNGRLHGSRYMKEPMGRKLFVAIAAVILTVVGTLSWDFDKIDDRCWEQILEHIKIQLKMLYTYVQRTFFVISHTHT